SWPGCTLDDTRSDRIARYLRASKSFFDDDSKWDFERVITGREVFQKLVSPPLSLSEAEAKRRLRGTLLGPDDQTTCMIVTFTPDAVSRRREVVPLIHAVLNNCDVPLEDQHLAGPVIDGLSVDEAGRQSMSNLALPSAIMVFLICYWCLKSFRAACLVFLMSLYAQMVTLALLHLGGETMSALLIVKPPLIQVLAVAGGIHLIHYYWEGVRNGNVSQAADHAFRVGWLPCTLASATTALGLASLMVSDLAPVKLFGTYGAAGVLLTAGLLLAVLPGTLKRWPLPPPSEHHRLQSLWDHQWTRLTHKLGRFQWLVLATILTAMGFASVGLKQLQTSVRVETLFASNSRILSDYRWLEEHVAPLVPIDVMVRFPINDQWTLTKQLEFVRQVENEISTVKHVSGTLSARTFLPNEGSTTRIAGMSFGQLNEPLLKFAVPKLIEANFIANAQGDMEWTSTNGLERPEYRDWRITAHVSAVEELDYGELLTQIERKVDPLLPQSSDRSSQQIQVTYTGIMPLVHAIQHRLMTNLFQSFLMAIATIGLTMILLQGGGVVGMMSMLPNLFPPVLLLGLLGWMG
ncbi:MAG: MMPL family transporter, partial [Planctomycetaceae bacterium]|nr:MMPL family transporter [Planctomycetaceae bacterium]